jgi:lysophospholipase L1-like esterase
LPRFYRALGELERGQRSDHVRVLWLGDSHTSADIWPNTLRVELGQRFFRGGPGFLHLGSLRQLCAGATLDHSGPWRSAPRPPSLRSRTDDGVFGLGGVRTEAASPSAIARISLRADAAVESMRWQLLFRLGQGARFEVTLGAQRLTVGPETPVKQVTGSPITRLELQSKGPLQVGQVRGQVQFFGVIVEGSKSGLVIDTLGIDGARIQTPLAWDETAWASEVGARNPVLVIVAYGTNEVFDRLAPDRYAAQLSELMSRIRRTAPESDCLIVGPPDAADLNGASHPRVAEITMAERRAAVDLGCAFFSAAQAMGGYGSFSSWAQLKPPLARSDRIHLTEKGYEELGRAMAKALMSGYESARR